MQGKDIAQQNLGQPTLGQFCAEAEKRGLYLPMIGPANVEAVVAEVMLQLSDYNLDHGFKEDSKGPLADLKLDVPLPNMDERKDGFDRTYQTRIFFDADKVRRGSVLGPVVLECLAMAGYGRKDRGSGRLGYLFEWPAVRGNKEDKTRIEVESEEGLRAALQSDCVRMFRALVDYTKSLKRRGERGESIGWSPGKVLTAKQVRTKLALPIELAYPEMLSSNLENQRCLNPGPELWPDPKL
ncbi:hypothetical protein [Ferrimonas marina]|uniref:Uncharacterized protein n=1 Tax=Ferrimonas marina TaxID=299255 RepID=A0A1M5ULJ7_9GAMM|nr:hypothetical protein [Ferrimonas marina]SHH63912.1 hypothetical protein SAMN02745129_2629 [Ferrimonas marina]